MRCLRLPFDLAAEISYGQNMSVHPRARAHQESLLVMNAFWSLSICVAMLLHMASKTMVEAFCTPVNGTSLQTAVNACLKETPDGSCPNLAALSDSPGCGYGGVNGVIGDWDVSSVTDMRFSTSLSFSLPLFLTHLYLILIMNLLL